MITNATGGLRSFILMIVSDKNGLLNSPPHSMQEKRLIFEWNSA